MCPLVHLGVGGAHTVRPERESPVRGSCDRAIDHDRHPPRDHNRRSNKLRAMASLCWRRQRSHRCFIDNWLTGRRVGAIDSLCQSSLRSTCVIVAISASKGRPVGGCPRCSLIGVGDRLSLDGRSGTPELFPLHATGLFASRQWVPLVQMRF